MPLAVATIDTPRGGHYLCFRWTQGTGSSTNAGEMTRHFSLSSYFSTISRADNTPSAKKRSRHVSQASAGQPDGASLIERLDQLEEERTDIERKVQEHEAKSQPTPLLALTEHAVEQFLMNLCSAPARWRGRRKEKSITV